MLFFVGRAIIFPDDDEPDRSSGEKSGSGESAGAFGGFTTAPGPSVSGPTHRGAARSSNLAVRDTEHADRLEIIHHRYPRAHPDHGDRTDLAGPGDPDPSSHPIGTHTAPDHRPLRPGGPDRTEPVPAEQEAEQEPDRGHHGRGRPLPPDPGSQDRQEPADQTLARYLPAAQELEELLARFREERRRRRSVRAARVLVALVALGLLAVWLLDPPLPWGDENRIRAAFPGVSPSGLLNGSDAEQTDAALRDRLALRQYVVEAIGEASRDRLGASMNPDVVLGRNRIPFLSEDFTLPCQEDFDPTAVGAGLDELTRIADGTGKSIMVAIAPDKSAIMTDDLGARAGSLLACADQVRAATVGTWGERSDGPVVISWDQLQAAQDEHPGSMFQKGDSHWTSKGALIWSRTVIDALIARGEAPRSLAGAPDAVRVGDEPADNDLYRMMGISRTASVPVYQVTRDDVTIRAHTESSPSGRGVAVFRAWSTTAPMITGRTLVVNDSFISRAEGLLAPYFTHLEVMHWSDFLTAVDDGELPSFDRIIIETVQRGWPQRAGWLTEGQPMYQLLAEELAAPADPGAGS